MAKKNISKIITSGSMRQKLLLYTDHVARSKYLMEGLLTDREKQLIIESVVKPKDYQLWERFKRMDEIVTNAIVNLQGLLYEVKMHYSNLRGYILVWNSIENAELMANYILHEIKDLEQRKKVAGQVTGQIELLFSKTTVDEEGYIEQKIDFIPDKIIGTDESVVQDYNLLTVMNNVRKTAINSAVQYLSWADALNDYMDENKFKVLTYKNRLKDMRKEIYTPIIQFPKYSGKPLRGQPNKRLNKVFSKYAISPTEEDLQVDEEKYLWFWKNFLDGEYPEDLRGKVNRF